MIGTVINLRRASGIWISRFSGCQGLPNNRLRKPFVGFRIRCNSLLGSRALSGGGVDFGDGLVPALEAAFARGGIHLVAVPIDYSENIGVLVDELRSVIPCRY